MNNFVKFFRPLIFHENYFDKGIVICTFYSYLEVVLLRCCCFEHFCLLDFDFFHVLVEIVIWSSLLLWSVMIIFLFLSAFSNALSLSTT